MCAVRLKFHQTISIAAPGSIIGPFDVDHVFIHSGRLGLIIWYGVDNRARVKLCAGSGPQ